VLFLGGVAVAGAGVLGLPATAAGRVLRRAAVVVTVAAGAGFGLAGTAHREAHGVVIPALHDAASDRPIPYTPVCGRAAGVPVCVHPAFRTYLQDITTALGPVLAEVAGLPGAPARVQEIPTKNGIGNPLMGSIATVGGSPPVFDLPVPDPGVLSAAALIDSIRTDFVTTYIAGSGAYVLTTGTPAQRAVEMALLKAAGVQKPPHVPPPPAAVSAAASRFAVLSAAARHAWLEAHLPALRAGHVTLAQLP